MHFDFFIINYKRGLFEKSPLKPSKTFVTLKGVEFMKIYDYNGKKNKCGERVREARRRQNISQEYLAARLQIAGVNIERNSLSRIETGDRFVADFELVALCKALNVTPEYLLGMDEH